MTNCLIKLLKRIEALLKYAYYRYLLMACGNKVFIILIKIQKHMMRIKTLCAPLIYTAIYPFSLSLSSQLRTASYRNYVFKASNMRFRSNELSLLPYFYHPAIEAKSESTVKYYEIKDATVLNLIFLTETTEEFVQSAWENRKTMKLSFRDALKLMKMPLHSNQVLNMQQQTYKDQNSGKIYNMSLIVTDRSQKAEVEMIVRETSHSENSNEQENLWELKFILKYDDYLVFSNNIRNNFLNISGAKFNIEVTKEENLIQIVPPRFQPRTPFEQEKSQAQKTAKGKGKGKGKQSKQ